VRKWTSAAVVAAGTTLYATPDHTYLAATTWTDPATATSGTGSGSGSGAKALPQVTGGQSTQIHLFDTSGRNRPHYVASGEVTGALLNQFSMDEFGGDLRVATTTSPTGGPILMGGGTVMLGDGSGGGSGGGPAVDVAPIPPGDSAGIAGGPSGGAGASSGQASASSGQASASSGQAAAPVSTSAATAARAVTADGSRVTVLRRSGDRLGAVGQVSGLGRGEQIYAVRFVGAVGYVVTFRQTDPLYTLDLSDAKAPRVVGELKLLGYSAYLHPAGDGLLIGIGQSADGAGHVQGLQLSLFDVHDPARPVRLSQVKLPQAWSDAQGDHHAFTFADGLVLIPFQRNDFGIVAPVAASADGSVVSTPAMPLQDSGVVAVRLAGQRLGTPTYLRMQGSGPVRSDLGVPFVQPLRTYVDGGDIWTVTTAGLGVHDATTLKRLGFTRF